MNPFSSGAVSSRAAGVGKNWRIAALMWLLLLGMLVAALAGRALPASAATPPTPTITLTGPEATYVAYPATLLVDVSEPAAPGETVTLEKKSGLSWSFVDDAVLDSSSHTSFTVTPGSTTQLQYRVKIAASGTHSAATSATYTTKPVLKTPDLTLTGPGSVLVNTPAVLTVTVTDPEAPGETVTLQRLSGLFWANAGTATLEPDSSATFTVTPTSLGTTTYRAKIAAVTGQHAAATSAEYNLNAVSTPPPYDCGGVAPLKSDGTRWACTFGDEFDGTDLDRGKWVVAQTANGALPMPNGGCYVDSPNNLAVGNGQLHLTARVESQSMTCGSYTSSTTGGAVSTRSHFNQTFGRFEFRARFPGTNVQGAHSALWMNPNALTYGPWPASGEIDVAEWYSAIPGQVYPTLHYVGQGNQKVFSGDNCLVSTANSAFHRYAVEWAPSGMMRFYYDGTLCFEHMPDPAAPLTAPQPFDKAFNVVMNQAYGALWNAPTAQTPNSVTMDVDWARVWK